MKFICDENIVLYFTLTFSYGCRECFILLRFFFCGRQQIYIFTTQPNTHCQIVTLVVDEVDMLMHRQMWLATLCGRCE